MYSQLSSEASDEGRKRWRFSPKHHLFLHLCEWQAIEIGNPRFYWTYADEDLVGKMIECARSCHPRTMAAIALYKWLCLLMILEPKLLNGKTSASSYPRTKPRGK